MIGPDDAGTAALLWAAVVASGLYHGLNPGMGWPLAVSAGMLGRGRRDLLVALGPLAAGHGLAMLAVLLPFSAVGVLLAWQFEIRLGAALVVTAAGLYLLIDRRHPQVLARIPPHRLLLWSFAIATAHGAGLMLLPVYLGLCGPDATGGHEAAATLMTRGLVTALAVTGVHALAMVVAGGAMALLAFGWVGIGLVRASWLNLDTIWALSLLVVGLVSLWMLLPA